MYPRLAFPPIFLERRPDAGAGGRLLVPGGVSWLLLRQGEARADLGVSSSSVFHVVSTWQYVSTWLQPHRATLGHSHTRAQLATARRCTWLFSCSTGDTRWTRKQGPRDCWAHQQKRAGELTEGNCKNDVFGENYVFILFPGYWCFSNCD